MKRYQIGGVEHLPTGVIVKSPLLEDDNGEWVRYEDVKDAIHFAKTMARMWADNNPLFFRLKEDDE